MVHFIWIIVAYWEYGVQSGTQIPTLFPGDWGYPNLSGEVQFDVDGGFTQVVEIGSLYQPAGHAVLQLPEY